MFMENEDLKLIIAQQVVIWKKLEKLEQEIKGGSRLCSAQAYADELKREAMKIIDQIKI